MSSANPPDGSELYIKAVECLNERGYGMTRNEIAGAGISFELLAPSHVSQIKQRPGIAGVATTSSISAR